MAQRKLHNNVRLVRLQHGLTQEQLAMAIGVSRKTINVIEGGDYSPSITLALSIAGALHVGVEELFSLEDN